MSGRKTRRPFPPGEHRRFLPILLLAMAGAGGAARLEAAIQVALEASPAGSVPVGTMIRWTARASGDGFTDLWYRFRVRERAGALRMIRDFGPGSTLDWTSLDEGLYELEVTVRGGGGPELQTVVSSVRLLPRVRSLPAVSATSHPLVFLFSSPGCQIGRARVRFESAGGVVQYTPYKACVPGRSLNFYLAALARNTTYSADLVVETPRDWVAAPAVTFSTGNPSFEIDLNILQAGANPGPERTVLHFPLFFPAFATDLAGNVVWFGPTDMAVVTRPEPGGTFFGLARLQIDLAEDIVRKFDLVGMTVLETNAARVSEQLVAMGKRPISGFHHEARSISGGRTVVLAGVEQILTDVQGPGPIDVLGDMIVVLDADLQVVWSWDAFDHLDVSRQAVFGETCRAYLGCAPYYLAEDANDWTHANSVSETPDGALLLSVRHQDWVLKIDYGRGEGSGDVIWRLGKDGDFTFESDDPYPWFSHQHDASYEPGRRSTIVLFDNGNARANLDPAAKSRGQVIELDEPKRIARLALNADLGVLAHALGSAQRLADGHYFFGAGLEADSRGVLGGVGYAIEVAATGEIASSMVLMRPVYRSFRVVDLYGPTEVPADRLPRVLEFRDGPATSRVFPRSQH